MFSIELCIYSHHVFIGCLRKVIMVLIPFCAWGINTLMYVLFIYLHFNWDSWKCKESIRLMEMNAFFPSEAIKTAKKMESICSHHHRAGAQTNTNIALIPTISLVISRVKTNEQDLHCHHHPCLSLSSRNHQSCSGEGRVGERKSWWAEELKNEAAYLGKTQPVDSCDETLCNLGSYYKKSYSRFEAESDGP